MIWLAQIVVIVVAVAAVVVLVVVVVVVVVVVFSQPLPPISSNFRPEHANFHLKRINCRLDPLSAPAIPFPFFRTQQHPYPFSQSSIGHRTSAIGRLQVRLIQWAANKS